MPIDLVRIHPKPPFFVNSTEDGPFDTADHCDPERATALFAFENGLGVGDSVWLGWGRLPSTSHEWDFDVAHVEEWVVLWTDDDGLPLVLPATFDSLSRSSDVT